MATGYLYVPDETACPVVPVPCEKDVTGELRPIVRDALHSLAAKTPLKTGDVIRKKGIKNVYYQVLGREKGNQLIVREFAQGMTWLIPVEEIGNYEKVSF